MTDKKKIYTDRSKRMIQRWSGQQIPTHRTNPNNESQFQRQESACLIDKDSGKVIEPSKTIDVLDQCDVLVVGAGPAGISAALASKRAGSDTILMERYGCFGGVITTE